jgi:hypothetical protein
VFDVTLRSDIIVAKLLSHLDKTVGKGRYLVALTADHGICPIPEVAKSKGKDAERLSGKKLRASAEAFLNKSFGGPQKNQALWIDATSNGWVYLNPKRIRDSRVSQAEVVKALARWLRQQPGVQSAYSREELQEIPKEDVIGQRVARSYYSARSGDVFAVLKPYWLLGEPLETGTTHGSPHDYDTHVPLLVYGPGIVPGIRVERISPLATAAIFARALRIPAPSDADTPVPRGLFFAK